MINHIKLYENGSPFNRGLLPDFRNDLRRLIQSCEWIKIDAEHLKVNLLQCFELQCLGGIFHRTEIDIDDNKLLDYRTANITVDLIEGISPKSKLAFLYLLLGPNGNLAHHFFYKKEVTKQIHYRDCLHYDTAEKTKNIDFYLGRLFKKHGLVIDFYTRLESENVLIIEFLSAFDRLAFHGFIEWGDTDFFKQNTFQIAKILADERD